MSERANSVDINNYHDFCSKLQSGSKKAQLLLKTQDLFLRCCEYDPKTGEGRYCDLDTFLERIEMALNKAPSRDRLSWIMAYAYQAINHLIRNTHEELVRIHRMLPIHQAKQVDNASLVWLSRQQGRSVKEKLSNKHEMLAPTREWIINTEENQLLKAYLQKLRDLYELKQAALNLPDDFFNDLSAPISAWLADNRVREIKRWQNLAPNNLLLSDKNYRKIWDSWGWLCNLDDSYQQDFKVIKERGIEAIFWAIAANLRKIKATSFILIPCVFSMPQFTTKTFWPKEADDPNTHLYLEGFLGKEKIKLKALKKTHTVNLSISNILDCRIEAIKEMFKFTLTQESYQKELFIPFDEDFLKVIEQEILPRILDKSTSELKKSEVKLKEKAKTCVINLSAVQPHYCLIDNGIIQNEKVLPYKLLGQFHDCGKCGEVFLDGGMAQSFLISKENSIVTSFDLFSGEIAKDSDAFYASQLFLSKLHDSIYCSNFYYLVPDASDEIAMFTVRRQLNLYFPNAQSLPKSISTVFSLLKDRPQVFEKQNKVLLLCASIFGSSLTITPLIGVKNKDLIQNLPQSGGMQWERFPSITYEIEKFKDLVAAIFSKGLKEKLKSAISLELSVLQDLMFTSLVYKEKNVLNSRYISPKIIHSLENELKSFKQNINKILEDVKKQVLPDANTPIYFISSDLPLNITQNSQVTPLGHFSSVKGGSQLVLWQNTENCPPLWKDHLPELFIRATENGKIVYKSLVQSTLAVLPQYGKTIKINSLKLILPANKEYYKFPLTKSEKGKILKYEMQIKSSHFPLKNDVACNLDMEYTYGAEKPYRLFITPTHESSATFRRIEANWVSAEKIARNNPVPKLPHKKSWQDLRKFPNRNGKGTSDLIDWMLKNLSDINKICEKYQEVQNNKPTIVDNFNLKIRKPKNSTDYCFLPNLNGPDIYCNVNNYHGSGSLFNANRVYLNVKKTPDGKYSASLICDLEEEYRAELEKSFKNRLKNYLENLPSKLHFPAVQIWQEGRSCQDYEAPYELRVAVLKFIENLNTIKNTGLGGDKLYNECLTCASRMHKDVAHLDLLWQYLKISINKNPDTISILRLSNALGDLSLTVQQELHRSLLDNLTGWKLRVLAATYWRYPEDLKTLNVKDLNLLGKAILRSLSKLLVSYNKDKFFALKVTKLCELILALLRTRDFQDPQIQAVFDANGEMSENLIPLIEKLVTLYSEHPFEIKSYVRLELKKPDNYSKLPDLLYAVYMYLTGDDGAYDIVITEFVDDVEKFN